MQSFPWGTFLCFDIRAVNTTLTIGGSPLFCKDYLYLPRNILRLVTSQRNFSLPNHRGSFPFWTCFEKFDSVLDCLYIPSVDIPILDRSETFVDKDNPR